MDVSLSDTSNNFINVGQLLYYYQKLKYYFLTEKKFDTTLLLTHLLRLFRCRTCSRLKFYDCIRQSFSYRESNQSKVCNCNKTTWKRFFVNTNISTTHKAEIIAEISEKLGLGLIVTIE